MPPFAHPEEIDRLLTTTKALRRRLDLSRPVPRHVISDCIRIGCYAPNASNAQDWRWVVVDEPEQRHLVGEHYRKLVEPPVTQMLASKLEIETRPGRASPAPSSTLPRAWRRCRFW